MYHFSVPWEITHFRAKALNHLDKKAHQSVTFQTFDCSQEISPNSYSDSVLLMKVYKISTKKVRRSYVSWQWKVMQNFSKIFVSKMVRVLWMWTQTLESLENAHFDLFLLRKEYNVCLKKYRGVILHETEEWCKVWRKLTCGLENDKRNLVIFTRALKSLKIGTLMQFFYPK